MDSQDHRVEINQGDDDVIEIEDDFKIEERKSEKK